MKWFLENPNRQGIWEHRPLSITEWIDYGGGLEDILRPRIKQLLIDVFSDLQQYREIIIIGGIGIGKSFFVGASMTYMMHRLMCLKDPHKYFGLAYGTPIAIMNMSINAMQAKKVVFGQVKARVELSPWFKRFQYLPDTRIQSELKLPKEIEVLPGNSEETFPAGFDLYAGVLDEGAWHTVTKDKDYAEEGYNMMFNRMRSRFPYDGKVFIVTSPRYVDDFVEKKFEESRYNPAIYAARIKAWDSAPPTMRFSGETFDFDNVNYQILEGGHNVGNI